MAESKGFPTIKMGILLKVLLRFLLLAIIPLIALGWFSLNRIGNVGSNAVNDSKNALNEKSTEAIELRTVEIAKQIAHFLQEREDDLRALALFPRDVTVYEEFMRTRTREVWRRNTKTGEEERIKLPIYSEAVFVDRNGYEQVRVIDGIILDEDPPLLRNVIIKENTNFHAEEYFNEAKKLVDERRGEIYVSHLIGRYLLMDDVLLDGETILDAKGKYYQGIIRFAIPIFDENDNFNGVVGLALNHTHLMEHVLHIVPTEERFALIPNPEEGNEAYIVDDEGWFIATTQQWMIRGVNKYGESVPPASESIHLKDRFLTQPVNLIELQTVLDEFPQFEKIVKIPDLIARGEKGSLVYFWEGQNRFVAYAPIEYFGGEYTSPAGFGWVGVGANVDKFYEDAEATAAEIAKTTATTRMVTIGFILIFGLAAIGIAYQFAQGITRPILRLTELADKISMGDLELKIDVRSADEIGALADSISRLATSLQAAMKRLTRARAKR